MFILIGVIRIFFVVVFWWEDYIRYIYKG